MYFGMAASALLSVSAGLVDLKAAAADVKQVVNATWRAVLTQVQGDDSRLSW